MTEPTYHLSEIPGFNDAIHGTVDANLEKFYSIRSYTTKENINYTIVGYNKELLFSSTVPTYGLLRSVIVSADSKVVCFSPPKSLSADTFISQYPSKVDNIVAEEFVEGTMINVFYDYSCGINGCWQISTRNTVGANVSFYKDSDKTFNKMFLEACTEHNFNFSTLNPLYCYSFVLQHPSNRIVIPIKKPQLYLVEVYQIVYESKTDTYDVIQQDLDIVKTAGLWHLAKIQFPKQYEFNNYSELVDQFASPNTPYDVMGVVIKNKKTGERTKIRNPIYEEVRFLRGNQTKLQYQYLCLRHSGKVPEFIKYYPETKDQLSKYRDQIHMFTKTLHQNYIDCYVKKEKPLRDFPDQYRTHMFKLHEKFLNHLRPTNLFVTNTVVIKYVNELSPSLLMYSLNHNLRKRMIDTIKSEAII